MSSSDWLKLTSHSVSNSLFYRSQELNARISTKSVAPIVSPADVVVMPDSDIANLGKSRQYGGAWVCGDFVEVIQNRDSHLTGVAPTKTGDGWQGRPDPVARAAMRASKQVRRLANSGKLRYMWTLTFAPRSPLNDEKYNCISDKDQRDHTEVRQIWRRFVMRLYRATGKFDWLCILELHDSEKTSEQKKGTYHLHFGTASFLDYDLVAKCWKHGGVQFEDFKKPRSSSDVGSDRGVVRNPGAYMSKYVGKAFDESNFNQKRYTVNRGFPRPRKITLENFFLNHFKTSMIPVFSQAKIDKATGETTTISITYEDKGGAYANIHRTGS